jgi:hypothetical protein
MSAAAVELGIGVRPRIIRYAQQPDLLDQSVLLSAVAALHPPLLLAGSPNGRAWGISLRGASYLGVPEVGCADLLPTYFAVATQHA